MRKVMNNMVNVKKVSWINWLKTVIMLFAFHFSPNSCFSQSWTADNGNGTYTNPLFYDEFSDPDIIRVGGDYYLAGTTMHTVPGLVILHSKDLVNWENISYCFDRFDFTDDAFSLKNHKEIYGQGVWAPAIRYANGLFYVFTNINGKGLQCYTSKDIRGPWKHHNMQGRIYDLSVLFDDDGKIRFTQGSWGDMDSYYAAMKARGISIMTASWVFCLMMTTTGRTR